MQPQFCPGCDGSAVCVLRIAVGVKQCRLITAEISRPKLVQEEVEEVEQKLTEAEHSRSQLRRFCTKFCTPVFLEAFVLTFLAGVCCA